MRVHADMYVRVYVCSVCILRMQLLGMRVCVCNHCICMYVCVRCFNIGTIHQFPDVFKVDEDLKHVHTAAKVE